jgi:hypothetical protein
MSLDAAPELAHVRTVEDLLERVEALPEPARDTTLTLIRALLALYGEGLARITGAGFAAATAGTGPDALAARLAADELVSHLLLLHDLHPSDARERIGLAVRRLAGRLGGARAELLEVRDGVARLRVDGAGGCGSPAGAVDAALEEAVRAAAPEITGVEVVRASAPATVIPLDSLRQRIDAPPRPAGTGGVPSRAGTGGVPRPVGSVRPAGAGAEGA